VAIPPTPRADGDSNPLFSGKDSKSNVDEHKAVALEAAEVLSTLGIIYVEEHCTGVQLVEVSDQAGHITDASTPPLPLRSVAAYRVWQEGDLYTDWCAAGLSTSDDAELQAIAAGVDQAYDKGAEAQVAAASLLGGCATTHRVEGLNPSHNMLPKTCDTEYGVIDHG
jgi:hypothetical protein